MTTITDDFAGLSPAEDITNDGNWSYLPGNDGYLRGTAAGGALEINVRGVRTSAFWDVALSSSYVYVQASVSRLSSGVYGVLGVLARHGLSDNTYYYLEPDSFNGVYYLAKMVSGADQWSVTIPIVPAVGHVFKLVVTSGNIVQAFIDQGSGFPGSPDASRDDSASPLPDFHIVGIEGYQSPITNSWWSTTWWPSPWWGSAWWPDYTAVSPAIDNFEAGDISTGATATGSLVSAVAAIAGSGARTITTTGALVSTVATIAGFQGTTTVTSTGALASPASTIDGLGYKSESANRWFNNTWWPEPYWNSVWWNSAVINATGSLSSDAAVIDGAGVRAGDTTGSLVSQTAAIAGVAERTVVSTGDLASDVSLIEGFARRVITSDGALASAASAIVGLAQLGGTTVAIGDLASADAVMAGVSEREITSTGDLACSDATILGVAAHGFDATGDLASDAALIDGTADVVNNLVIGILVSEPATMQGLGFREIVARGDIRSAPATIEGFSILADHPTPRELLLRAVFDAFESGEAFDGMVQGQIQINLDRLTTRDLLWTALKHAGESTEDVK